MFVFLAAAALSTTCCSHTFSREQGAFLNSWLKHNQAWVPAEDSDSACLDDIAAVRKGQGTPWKPVKNYLPYQVIGDFNHDGLKDMAVVLKNKGKTAFELVVFNGPFAESHEPAFREALNDMTCAGLFFGPPRSKPYSLIVGPFESEGSSLIPAGATYKWEAPSDDE
jgi:hypothetical protein